MKLKNFIAVGLALAPTAAFAIPARLNIAGATFPEGIYVRWFGNLAKAGGPKVNYQATGSGAGRKAFIDETVSLGATDDPIKDKDRAKVSRGVVQIPTVGGTIAIAYNNPACKLKLTQKQAVSVFMGSIDNWKELGCPDGKIVVAHRSDGSGTTFAFTNSLDAFGGWTAGVGKSINWPTGVGAKGNEGVAGTISNTPGGIGYINTGFVRANKLQAAVLQNKAGKFVGPSAVTGAAALNSIKLDPVTLAGEDPNPSNPRAYPISTLTWIVAYKSGYAPGKAEAVRDAINYALSSKAQSIADDLGYVPLAGSVLHRARLKVQQIGMGEK